MNIPRLRDLNMPHPARIAVTVFFMISGAILANWIVRIPDIKAQLQLSDGQLGLALLSIPAGAFIGQILTGWLLPKWGSRRLTILLTILSCVLFPLLGLANSLLVLMLTLAIFGICFGGMDVAMNAQGALVERTNGRPIMSSLHGMWSVAGLISASIGGYLAGRATPIILHFFAMALVSFVAALAFYRSMLVEQEQVHGEGHALAMLPRALLPLGAIAFSVMLCEGAIGDWSAIYLRESLGSPPAIAAIGYVVFSLLMTVGRLTGDWLTMRLGAARIVRGGGLLVIIGIGLALFIQIPIIAIIGFGLIGAGLACPFPLILSTASRSPGVDPGRAIAAMATVAYTGSLLGPPLIGSIAEAMTLRGALGLLGLAGLLMFLIGGVVQPTTNTHIDTLIAPS
jgi:MFS family permease